MTEQEKREKAIEEIHNILVDNNCPGLKDDNLVCPRSTCSECTAMGIYDNYLIRKEEEVRKECDKNAYNAWKAMFGLKEKTIREEVRKETIEEILRFIEMEHYSSAMVTLIEDIKTKFLGWKHPMSVEVEE